MNLVTQGNLNIEHFNVVDGKLNVIFPTGNTGPGEEVTISLVEQVGIDGVRTGYLISPDANGAITIDTSKATIIAGPEGPIGPKGNIGPAGIEGRGLLDTHRFYSNNPTATYEDLVETIKGPKGDKGDSGIATGNIDLSSILSAETKDMIYYNTAAKKLLDGSLLEEDLQAYRDSVQNMSGITGLYVASSTIASMFRDLGVDIFADPDRQFTLTDVTNWVRQYSQNNWRADILYMLDLEERPVLDFPIDGTILRRISKAHTFEVSRKESILNFFSYAHAVAPTDEQIPTGLTFNAGERYIYRCSSTDQDGYPAIRFGMSLYNKDTNQQITKLVFNEYNLPDPEKYKRMYFDKSVYTVSYRNADNKFCLGVVDATTHERIGHLTSDVTLEDNVFYYLKPYSSGSWYEAVNIYRLYDLDGVVQYGEPLPQFYPTSGYKEIVSMVKMDGANTPIAPRDSVAEPVRIGDTVSTAISGLDLINNSYRMSMGSPHAPGTSKLVFSIMDGADVNLGSVELTRYNTHIPGYENYVLFTGFEDWLFYTKDNKIYFSSVNNRDPGGSASELMRNVLVEDAAAAGTSLRIVMTPTPSIRNPNLDKYKS